METDKKDSQHRSDGGNQYDEIDKNIFYNPDRDSPWSQKMENNDDDFLKSDDFEEDNTDWNSDDMDNENK